jgi:hypothetical protein
MYKLDIAQKVISSKKINWPQIVLSKNIEDLFKINSYPTNIIILPDGINCIRTGPINYDYISKMIK